MAALNPVVLLRHLKIVGMAINMACKHWRHLLPVVLGAFLLHVALTTLLVNLASRTVNLDSMLLFYEIDDNSTVPAADAPAAMAMSVGVEDEGAEISPLWKLHLTPLWKLHLTGLFFWRLSFIITMVFFSKACQQDHGGVGQGVSRASAWRACMSWAFWTLVLSFIEDAMVFLTITALEAEDRGHSILEFFDSGYVYLLAAAIVSSEGGINYFSALDKAWQFVAQNLKDIFILGITLDLLGEVLERVCWTVISGYQSKQEGAAVVIKEDNAVDIFRFSLVAAMVTLMMQAIICTAVLALYRKLNEPPQQQINGQPHQN